MAEQQIANFNDELMSLKSTKCKKAGKGTRNGKNKLKRVTKLIQTRSHGEQSRNIEAIGGPVDRNTETGDTAWKQADQRKEYRKNTDFNTQRTNDRWV